MISLDFLLFLAEILSVIYYLLKYFLRYESLNNVLQVWAAFILFRGSSTALLWLWLKAYEKHVLDKKNHCGTLLEIFGPKMAFLGQ